MESRKQVRKHDKLIGEVLKWSLLNIFLDRSFRNSLSSIMGPSALPRRLEILVSFLTIILISTHILQVFVNHLFIISLTDQVYKEVPAIEHYWITFHAFVSSKLDYCNSLLYGLPNYQIKKLHHVQNAAARIVSLLFQENMNTSPLFFLNLHWLRINYRISFKVLLIAYKALNNLAPSYIRDLLIPYIQSRQLRSSSKNLLSIAHFNLRTYGTRSFSLAATYSGILCRLTLRIVPQRPFLRTDLRLSFLNKHFSNFFFSLSC